MTGRHLTLSLVDRRDHDAKRAASEGLYRYNVERTGLDDRIPIGASFSDPETGQILGGLWGRTEFGLLFMDMLYLPEDLRGQSFGSRLLAAVEAEARRRGCERAGRGDQQLSGAGVP